MPTVTLGNTAVLEPYKPNPATDETKTRRRRDLGKQTTTFSLPAMTYIEGTDPPLVDETGWTFEKWLGAVTSMWRMHSDAAPAWIESDDPILEAVLASQFNCRKGRPQNWKVGK